MISAAKSPSQPQALSDFAEYVEKQQSIRFPSASRPAGSAVAAAATGTAAGPSAAKPVDDVQHHAELDDILDSLDLSDSTPRVPLRDLLLAGDDDEASLHKFSDLLQERLDAGHGEMLFDIGYEHNGESMGLARGDWDRAYAGLVRAAKEARADCQLLLTKNVGGEVEAQSTAKGSGKDKDCTGKVLIRQVPTTVEEVIETRIAVVGNVDAGKSSMLGVLVKGDLDDGRGKARVNLFRHKHEIETGRTSSVGMEIMGFDSLGQTITSDTPGSKCPHLVLHAHSPEPTSSRAHAREFPQAIRIACCCSRTWSHHYEFLFHPVSRIE